MKKSRKNNSSFWSGVAFAPEACERRRLFEAALFAALRRGRGARRVLGSFCPCVSCPAGGSCLAAGSFCLAAAAAERGRVVAVLWRGGSVAAFRFPAARPLSGGPGAVVRSALAC